MTFRTGWRASSYVLLVFLVRVVVLLHAMCRRGRRSGAMALLVLPVELIIDRCNLCAVETGRLTVQAGATMAGIALLDVGV